VHGESDARRLKPTDAAFNRHLWDEFGLASTTALGVGYPFADG
jgi:hypothetical protein